MIWITEQNLDYPGLNYPEPRLSAIEMIEIVGGLAILRSD